MMSNMTRCPEKLTNPNCAQGFRHPCTVSACPMHPKAMTATPETPKALTQEEAVSALTATMNRLKQAATFDNEFVISTKDECLHFASTINVVLSTIATQAAEIASARNDALGWRPSYEDLYKAVYTALVELKMSDETHEWKPVNGLDVPCVVATISQALLALKAPPIPAEGAK